MEIYSWQISGETETMGRIHGFLHGLYILKIGECRPCKGSCTNEILSELTFSQRVSSDGNCCIVPGKGEGVRAFALCLHNLVSS